MAFRNRGGRDLVRIIGQLVLFFFLTVRLLPSPGSLQGQSPAKSTRKVMVRIQPEFPDFFKNGHFQGHVIAEATVLPNGNVTSVEIKSGNPMFAAYASKALMKWKYAPAAAQTVEEVIFNFNSSE